MAILTQPTNTNVVYGFFDLEDTLPPAGTYPAVILDVVDKYDVERQKFQSTEIEKVNLTAFLFGFRGTDGQKYRIDTRPMKISGHPKSALYKFLTALLGRAPEYGWDYCALKGTQCLITIAHMVSQNNNPYAAITAAVPLPAGFAAYAQPAPARPAQPAAPAPQPAPYAPAPVAYAPPQSAPPVIPIADDDNGEEEIPF